MAASEQPLGGLRVVVTRPAGQADGLAAAIRDAGGIPIFFPTIEIAPPADLTPMNRALAAIPDQSLAIFLSRNAVNFGFPALQTATHAALHYVAIGAATAAALRQRGIASVTHPAGRSDSESLLAILPDELVRGRTALVFQGEGGRDLVAPVLTARGARAVRVICYRRILPAQVNSASLSIIARGEFDATTATSVESLHNLVRLAGEPGSTSLRARPLVVVSDRVRTAAIETGFHGPIRVSENADDNAIVSQLRAWRQSQKTL